MKYIINLYNTISNAQDVADRLNIDGTVLPNLKVIHVDDPTQEQVDLWLKDADIKNIIPDQITIIDDVSAEITISKWNHDELQAPSDGSIDNKHIDYQLK